MYASEMMAQVGDVSGWCDEQIEQRLEELHSMDFTDEVAIETAMLASEKEKRWFKVRWSEGGN